jgi:hypothetical protein
MLPRCLIETSVGNGSSVQDGTSRKNAGEMQICRSRTIGTRRSSRVATGTRRSHAAATHAGFGEDANPRVPWRENGAGCRIEPPTPAEPHKFPTIT